MTATGHRLVVDPVACDGIGMCALVSNGLVRLDSWGYPVMPDPGLTDREHRQASQAVAACPRQALRLRS